MWEYAAAFRLGGRDVIGAWLVCAAFGAACFTVLAVAAPDRGGSAAALINPDPIATVAAAELFRQRRC
jgi:hypothetical protein